jgi:hypothetical protein
MERCEDNQVVIYFKISNGSRDQGYLHSTIANAYMFPTVHLLVNSYYLIYDLIYQRPFEILFEEGSKGSNFSLGAAGVRGRCKCDLSAELKKVAGLIKLPK